MGALLRFAIQLALIVVLVGWLVSWPVFEQFGAVDLQTSGSLSDGAVVVSITYRPGARREVQRHAAMAEEDTGWQPRPVRRVVQPRAPREVEPLSRVFPVEAEPRTEFWR